jgi:hypothetical protein
MFEIYKTTRPSIDDAIYYGQHKLSKYPNANINYKGSGVRIRRSIDKYGLSLHVKEVLYTVKTKEEADTLERQLIQKAREKGMHLLNICSGGENNAAGCHYITNGIETRIIPATEHIPDGWKIGFVKPHYVSKNKGKIWITNGIDNFFHDSQMPVPEGFKKGMTRKNKNYEKKGYLLYTNGEKNIRIKKGDDIPEGFYKGTNFAFHSKNCGHRITNGIISKLLHKGDTLPDGFYFSATGGKRITSPSPKMKSINNGKHCLRVLVDAPIPEGYKIGNKFIWITNGEKTTKIKIGTPIPDGFYKGHTFSGKDKIINDGVHDRRIPIDAQVPDGWVNGSLCLALGPSAMKEKSVRAKPA